MKRFFDIGFSLVAIILLFPLCIVISGLILITMGRPILFMQKRPGFEGKLFHLYKFRTMREARNADGIYMPDESRLTSLGIILRKFSLDEIPQLFNVLKGDMSLVGPRPLLVKYLERYNERQGRRHEVRPGITGWAQVNGRNVINWEEKFEYDVWYVEHRSMVLDLKILGLTIMKVFKAEGINQAGHATAREFEGTDAVKGDL